MLPALSNPCPDPPWPPNPSPKRAALTNFDRALRLAERINSRFGVPVTILEQACPLQAHRLVIGEAIFDLRLSGDAPVPYRIVTTVF